MELVHRRRRRQVTATRDARIAGMRRELRAHLERYLAEWTRHLQDYALWNWQPMPDYELAGKGFADSALEKLDAK